MAGPGTSFRRLGALSGAGALALASYGAHGRGRGMELGLWLGRPLRSGAGAESMGSVGAPIDQTAHEALNLLKLLAWSIWFPELPMRASTSQKLPGGTLSLQCSPGSSRVLGVRTSNL